MIVMAGHSLQPANAKANEPGGNLTYKNIKKEITPNQRLSSPSDGFGFIDLSTRSTNGKLLPSMDILACCRGTLLILYAIRVEYMKILEINGYIFYHGISFDSI